MEEFEVSLAMDDLNRELPPKRGDGELLAIARAIRGLRAPAWPSDPAAFEGSLLPGTRRRWPLAAGLAAAVLLAAILALPRTQPAAVDHGGLSGFVVPAAPLQYQEVTGASAETPMAAARVPAQPEPAALRVLDLRLVEGEVVAMRLRLPRGTAPARIGTLSDLTGSARRVRLGVRSEGSRAGQVWSVTLAAPREPGWYLLWDGKLSQRIAFLMPYPPGSTLRGRWTGALSTGRGAGAVTLLAVDYSNRFTVVWVSLPEAVSPAAVELRLPGGRGERPLQVLGPQARGVYALRFDPSERATGETSLRLMVGSVRFAIVLPGPMGQR